MQIYEIDYDVKKYCGLFLKNESDYMLFPVFTKGSKKNEWRNFKAKLAEKNKYEIGDFAYLTPGVLILNGKALDAIKGAVKGKHEILPFVMNNKIQYFVFNLLNSIDCLDVKKSEINKLESGFILRIVKYVFKEKRLKNQILFKIPQRGTSIFCTEEFKGIVEKNMLTGLIFTRVG